MASGKMEGIPYDLIGLLPLQWLTSWNVLFETSRRSINGTYAPQELTQALTDYGVNICQSLTPRPLTVAVPLDLVNNASVKLR